MPGTYPASPVFYRNLTGTFPLAVRGEGCWITDADGKRYLDAVGGAFVVSAGHGVAEIADAVGAQARQLAYLNATHFTSEPAEELAARLVARAPGDLSHAYFLCSGSEAVEAALKLARQYQVEAGRPGKQKVLALAPGYHGNTLLALSASAREHYKTFFREWLLPVPRVPAPYAYRCACGGTPPLCPACSGDALEAALLAEGPDTVAAFIAEPIGGSSTGASVPPPGYWNRVRAICDRHDVLLVADEVLVGAGRTGTWSAIGAWDVTPDLMTLGKGITSGYAPLSAVLAPRRIVDTLAAGSGGLVHAQTFSHHPVLCAAALANLRYLDAHHLVERCATLGLVFYAALQRLRSLPFVGDVRGRGLLAGVEFVADVSTRAPIPRDVRFAERFTEAARTEGLLVWPNTGHADGTAGDLVMLAPPFVITEDEIDELVRRFSAALMRIVP